jgi:signal transduction histidine kinase
MAMLCLLFEVIMKKKFQVILSISMFILLSLGWAAYTLITHNHVYEELVTQVLKDNRVIGEAVVKLLKKTSITGQSRAEVAQSLQNICNEIMLPNKGYLCAIGADGYLIAAPGFNKDMKVDMKSTPLITPAGRRMTIKDLAKGQDFEGLAFTDKPAKTDIIVMMPIHHLGIQLMIHQNRNAVKTHALQQVKFLIPVGILAALLMGICIFFLVDRLVARYESRLQQLNKELTDSNRELLQASKQRKEFLHILSHDLTNPLGSIISLSEKLCTRATAADLKEVKHNGQLIRTSASHGLGVIQMVRQMQDLEARKLDLQLKPVDLKNVSEMAYRIMERKFYDKKIQLINKIPENLTVIAEIYSLCNTVFTNLLSNAVKFSHRSSSVEISAWQEEGFVKVAFVDSGIGMPDEILSQLFEITPQTLRPGTDGEIGTGFGMPLVKRLVEVYGGSISVISCQQDSQDDSITCGTTMTLRLRSQ